MLGKTLTIMVMILANIVKKASSTLNFRMHCLKEAVLPVIYHAVNHHVPPQSTSVVTLNILSCPVPSHPVLSRPFLSRDRQDRVVNQNQFYHD